MSKYDVVIIGAGPAGLKCAEDLCKSKVKVLLLEKNDVIGPKFCAGGLTAQNSIFKLPLNKTLNFKKHYVYLNGKKSSFNLVNPIYTISRYDLGQHQLGLIKNFKNLDIKINILVKEIGNNFIKDEKGNKYYFNYLVGADGSASIVRNYLKLKSKIYIGIQYIIPKTHNELVWFLNPKDLKSGYGWIFPHKDFTSAGVFYNPNYLTINKAKTILNKTLAQYGLYYKISKFEGAPVNCQYDGLKFDNIYLAGDAAGLASGNTGEGISFALASGSDIAKNIIDSDYNFENIYNLLKYKKRQELSVKIFDNMPSSKVQTMMFKLFIKLLQYPKFQIYYGN
jgi:geranylgeranyl reductase